MRIPSSEMEKIPLHACLCELSDNHRHPYCGFLLEHTNKQVDCNIFNDQFQTGSVGTGFILEFSRIIHQLVMVDV